MERFKVAKATHLNQPTSDTLKYQSRICEGSWQEYQWLLHHNDKAAEKMVGFSMMHANCVDGAQKSISNRNKMRLLVYVQMNESITHERIQQHLFLGLISIVAIPLHLLCGNHQDWALSHKMIHLVDLRSIHSKSWSTCWLTFASLFYWIAVHQYCCLSYLGNNYTQPAHGRAGFLGEVCDDILSLL